MTNVERILDQLKEALREELRAEVRQEIIAELGGGKPAKAKPSTADKLLKKATRYEKLATKFEKVATGSLKVKAGTRRSEEDVAAAAETLHKWFSKNPDKLLVDAAAALKAPAKDLQLPVAKLLADKRLKKKGERRWTRYTASGGKPAAKSKS